MSLNPVRFKWSPPPLLHRTGKMHLPNTRAFARSHQKVRCQTIRRFSPVAPICGMNFYFFHDDRHFCPIRQLPVAFKDDDAIFNDAFENPLHFPLTSFTTKLSLQFCRVKCSMVSVLTPNRSFAIKNHTSNPSSGSKSSWCSARSILLPVRLA